MSAATVVEIAVCAAPLLVLLLLVWLDPANLRGQTDAAPLTHKMSADIVPVCDADWADGGEVVVSWDSVDCPDCLTRKPS